ncbi:hypothetical protein VTO42DRAFT_1936 [Malbranchea cinnamomea]
MSEHRPHRPAAAAKPLREKSTIACARCRARKVRCDLVVRGSGRCSRCELERIPCTVAPKRDRRISLESTLHARFPSRRLSSVVDDENDALLALRDDIWDEILAAFVLYVHPQLPVMDLRSLEGNVRLKARCGGFSRLVLHAIAAAAFPHVDGSIARAAGFACPREASTWYVRRARSIYESGREQNPLNEIQALLLLSLCASSRTDGPSHDRGSIDDLATAISRARAAGINLRSAHRQEDGMAVSDRKLKKRLWSACYVQSRIALLLHFGNQQSTPLVDTAEIMDLSLDDFDFFDPAGPSYHTASTGATTLFEDIVLGGSFASHHADRQVQYAVAQLFQLKIELCRRLDPLLPIGDAWCDRIAVTMDRTHEHILGLIRSAGLGAPGIRCLSTLWESVVLLYHTVRLVMARRKWTIALLKARSDKDAEKQAQAEKTQREEKTENPEKKEKQKQRDGEKEQSQYLLHPPLDIQDALTTLVTMASQLRDTNQLRDVGNAALWALLPVLLTIAQFHKFLAPGREADKYREMYAHVVSILQSQRDYFDAVDAAMPLVESLLPPAPLPTTTTTTTPTTPTTPTPTTTTTPTATQTVTTTAAAAAAAETAAALPTVNPPDRDFSSPISERPMTPELSFGGPDHSDTETARISTPGADADDEDDDDEEPDFDAFLQIPGSDGDDGAFEPAGALPLPDDLVMGRKETTGTFRAGVDDSIVLAGIGPRYKPRVALLPLKSISLLTAIESPTEVVESLRTIRLGIMEDDIPS